MCVLHEIVLAVAPVDTGVVVTADATLMNAERTGSESHVGADLLRDRQSAAPGRSLIELVNMQPGWLLEANGILHPRGSEYDVQYVIDGVPLFDNRSPSFAQSLQVEEFQSLRVLTGGYPAEYGRKLGGVVEVVTDRSRTPGFSGKAVLQAGSFGARSGYVSTRQRSGRTVVGLSLEGFLTDRYLDPPVEENFTNRGSAAGVASQVERDWRDTDRTRVYLSHRSAGFLVPNERLQQAAGQRQDRRAEETSLQGTHQHVFSSRALGLLQARFRDTGAVLWSNPLSTPIVSAQDRGFRESYVAGSVTSTIGRHEMKAGGEAIFTSLREEFGYDIVAYRLGALRIFDSEVPERFRFSDRARMDEQSVFVQDRVRWRSFVVSLGARYDRYRLRAAEHAVSPRVGIAYSVGRAGLSLRASYDSVFQTPAVENVLLASSDLVESAGGEGTFLPLRASRGHFAEAGFSKTLLGRLRLDGTWFRRSLKNFADDSVFLNTGVSFPIAFTRGTVRGFEAKLDVPRWGPFSGFVSYSHLLGRGELPIAGGLFLGDEAEELVGSAGRFPISQDQRNTVRARIRTGIGRRAWAAGAWRYNSGLPVELEGVPVSRDVLLEQYGGRVLDRVNFERERVRPSASLDLSAGMDLLRGERYAIRIQADVLNVTDRLNVINFAGLLSGAAIEPRRNFAVRLHTTF
jgi:hypothetical protein